MERDLLEKLLVAQVLTLAAALRVEWHQKHSGSTGDHVQEAVREIRQRQADIITKLTAPPSTP